MGALGVQVDPAEAGFDPGRLAHIEEHFAQYVADGRLPGWLVVVSRGGRLAHVSMCGLRDVAADQPVATDTLWRLASMTKPITSVAAMLLYEQGTLDLDDPVADYIPSFADMRVYAGGPAGRPATVAALEPITIWHLLTHTAGLTYAFHRRHPVDELYRSAGFEVFAPEGMDLAQACDVWAGMPLLFQPGHEWNYSVATDVLGRVIEVASGMTLDRFFDQRIFAPLRMTDTAFAAVDGDRLAQVYTPHPATGIARPTRGMGPIGATVPAMLSGGAGLVGSAGDYHRFTQMLLRGGELDGVRLLSPRTVDFMTTNHLPGGADLQTFGRPLGAEVPFQGAGFGLGFSVLLDPVRARCLGSPGEYAWGGATSTMFWVDPAEELTAMFFTQLLPSSSYPLRAQLRRLVYQALVD